MDGSPQAPLSMEFSRQGYWSGLLFLTPGDLPNPGIKPKSLMSPALAGGFFTTVLSGKPIMSTWKWKWSLLQLFVTPWTIQSMEFSSQNTGVGSHSLLQRIFPTQGSNPGLPHCRRILYQLSHKGNPRILEWVAMPSSREPSRPRDGTCLLCLLHWQVSSLTTSAA